MAIGSTLAGMVNVETYLSEGVHVLPTLHAALLGGVRRQLRSGRVRRDGMIDASWRCESATRAEFNAFITATMGDFVTASKQLYIVTIDERGVYAPFLTWVEKPHPGEGWEDTNGAYLFPITIPLLDLELQSSTKTSNFTVTTSTHYLIADTSSGSITFALPAIAGVPQNVPYTFLKSSASNSMVLDPNGAETINGAATHTTTALNTFVTIVNNGTQWVTVSA